MRLFYLLPTTSCFLVYLWCLLLPQGAGAQTPTWILATSGPHASSTSASSTNAVATDGFGNVYVTGTFQGQLTLGNIVLTSDNANINTNTADLFVAKYVPSTNTWAWAQRGGGTFDDGGAGIVLSGTSVYITGYLTNTTTNARTVTFGGTNPTNSPVQVNGTSSVSSKDLFVAKYTDNGSSATLNWTQVGGGGGLDQGSAIAVSGANVYVTGYITNNRMNAQDVVFGGSGTTSGTLPQYGASTTSGQDIVVAKYTDNGGNATVNWTQVGGGSDYDVGFGIAVNGTSVYVVGSFINNVTNAMQVVFGGAGSSAGTVPQSGASSTLFQDMVLVKYTDAGPSASIAWTQAAGGTSTDEGRAVAVYNNQVYVTGYFTNNKTNTTNVLFGGTGTMAGTVPQYGASSTSSQDLLVAKYIDNGTSSNVVWTQVAGGTDTDWGQGITVSNGHVFVTGFINNNLANASSVVFGGTGTATGSVVQPGVSPYSNFDLVVASYLDSGSEATVDWTQVGGGQSSDWGQGLVLSGSTVYVVGQVSVPATFGSLPVSGPAANSNFLGALGTALLSTRSTGAKSSLQLYPNPATGVTTLLGASSSKEVQVIDAVGRLVLRTATDAVGTAHLVLPTRLPSGIYVVRAGEQVTRLVVE